MFGANYLPASAMLKDGSAGHDLQSWWPQDVGSNKTETRTAAAIVGQSLLATDPSFGNVTAVPARLSAHPTFGVGFLNTNLVLYSDGNNIQSFKPAEAGANVTETRTAAAIQGQSLLATNPDFAGVTGATRPSDNAGTSGILTPIGAHSVVFGNTVRKMGGTHGAFQGGAVGAAQKGSAFISASLLSAIAGGGWNTYLALDASPTNFNEPSATYACVYNAGAGTGTVSLRAGGVTVGSAVVSGVTHASRMTLAYDGKSVSVFMDGVRCVSTPALAGLRLWPKVIDYFLSGLNIPPPHNGIADVQYGAWTENTTSVLNLITAGANVEINGNSITNLSAGAWTGGAYSREAFAGSAVATFRPLKAAQDGMAGLMDEAVMATGSYTEIDYAVYTVLGTGRVHVYQGGSFIGDYTTYTVNDVFAVVYDGTHVRFTKNGVQFHSVITTPGRVFRFASSVAGLGAGFTEIKLTPGPEAARIDRINNAAGTAQYGQSQLVTGEGVASSVVGQSLAATTPLAGGAGYASNALALAALGVGKAYRNTTSNTLEVTYEAAGGSVSGAIGRKTESTSISSGSWATIMDFTLAGVPASPLLRVQFTRLANVAGGGGTTDVEFRLVQSSGSVVIGAAVSATLNHGGLGGFVDEISGPGTASGSVFYLIQARIISGSAVTLDVTIDVSALQDL